MVRFHNIEGSGSSLHQNPEEFWQNRAGGTLRIMFGSTVIHEGLKLKARETDKLPQGLSWIAKKAALILLLLLF